MRLIQTDTNILLINRHVLSSQGMKKPRKLNVSEACVCEGGYRDLKTYCLVKNRVVKGFFWHQITLILT